MNAARQAEGLASGRSASKASPAMRDWIESPVNPLYASREGALEAEEQARHVADCCPAFRTDFGLP